MGKHYSTRSKPFKVVNPIGGKETRHGSSYLARLAAKPNGIIYVWRDGDWTIWKPGDPEPRVFSGPFRL